MIINYYCIFDRSLQRSNMPFAAHDDGEAKEIVRNMFLSFDEEHASILPKIRSVCEVRYSGCFDTDTGEMLPTVNSGRFVFDLSGDSVITEFDKE